MTPHDSRIIFLDPLQGWWIAVFARLWLWCAR